MELQTRRLCETCGSWVDFEVLDGFCPNCLLHIVLERESQSAPGSRIEDYELLNEVARGGMGIVYRARQHAPSRVVALKVILPVHLNSLGALARFRAEAQTAASLDHAGILPIYAVGDHDGAPFYSMKFADGGALSDRLGHYRDKPREAAGLVASLARAVAHAHDHGILHRDLKPGNVVFDAANKPYVSDFGLAKWLQRECDLTQTLAVLGTPFYMAPEQAWDSRGVTTAVDTYSLGAILYHLLEGHPPVEGDTPMEVLQNANSQVPRLTQHRLPRDLATICLKALEKEPAARYSSAAALADDLDRFCAGQTIRARRAGFIAHTGKWMRRNRAAAGLAASLVAFAVTAGWFLWKISPSTPRTVVSPAVEESIAVLPFRNLIQESDSEYFVEGIRAQIAARLAKIPHLEVVSGSSVQRFDYNSENVREIASELDVRKILRGTIEKQSGKFRIVPHLIDAIKNEELWSRSYDCAFADVVATQNTIAREVTHVLKMPLSRPEERALNAIPTSDPRAYDAYLKGRYVWLQRTFDAYGLAKKYFEQAIELDPNCAPAHAGLADAYQFIAAFGVGDQKEKYDRARDECHRALQLDPNLPEAHASLGLISMNYDWNWPLAQEEFHRAVALDPNNAIIRDWYAEYLMAVGKSDLSLGQIDRGRQLDPFSPIINSDTGKLLYFARRFDEAESQLKETIRMYPDFSSAHYWLGHLYATEKRCDEAIQEFKKYSSGFGHNWAWGEMAYTYGVAGRRTEANQSLAALKKRPATDDLGLVCAYLGIGDNDKAIAHLEREYQSHDTTMTSLVSNPWYDSLRTDPRFLDLMRRVHLVPN